MREVLSILINVIVNLFYAFRCMFYKRDEGTILMDCWFGERFSDNPRFLFQYLSANKGKHNLNHVVWVTREKKIKEIVSGMGYECYMLDSKESKHYHKCAKYHIINNFPNDNDGYKGELLEGYSYGAKRINLWHGIAGKGVKFSNLDKVKEYERFPGLLPLLKWLSKRKIWRLLCEQRGGWGDCYYLTQSSQHRQDMISNFILSDENYLLTGWPRVKECLQYSEEEKRIIGLIKKFKCTILYLPTFRTKIEFDYSQVAREIQTEIQKNEFLWIQKGHHSNSDLAVHSAYNANIVDLDCDFDINVLFPYIDILITDYSSCFYEALYFNKGIIFYIPDYNEYVHNDRGLTKDINTCMPGKKAYTIEDLRSIFSLYKDNTECLKTESYDEIRALYWKETQNKTYNDIWTDIKFQVNKQ